MIFWHLTLVVTFVIVGLEILAIPVFIRLRSRHRKLYRALLFNPFKDVLWESDLHEFCNTGDMELVCRIRRYRILQQYAIMNYLAVVAVGAIASLIVD